jgi:hypothetical protein
MTALTDLSIDGPLIATKLRSEPTPDGVLVVGLVHIADEPHASAPIRLLLTPKDARSLAGQMATNANVVDRWGKTHDHA